MILLKARSAAPVDAERGRASRSREKLKTIVDLVPTAILILVVLGTIYGGLATATESAALGVVGAIDLRGDRGQALVPDAQRLGRGDRAQHRDDRRRSCSAPMC